MLIGWIIVVQIYSSSHVSFNTRYGSCCVLLGGSITYYLLIRPVFVHLNYWLPAPWSIWGGALRLRPASCWSWTWRGVPWHSCCISIWWSWNHLGVAEFSSLQGRVDSKLPVLLLPCLILCSGLALGCQWCPCTMQLATGAWWVALVGRSWLDRNFRRTRWWPRLPFCFDLTWGFVLTSLWLASDSSGVMEGQNIIAFQEGAFGSTSS